jgi:hypothetical protein
MMGDKVSGAFMKAKGEATGRRRRGRGRRYVDCFLDTGLVWVC